MLMSGSLKIVLVQPAVEDFYFTPHRSSALGLRSLAAAWTGRGHDCHILNFPMEKPLKKKLPVPDALAYLHPWLAKLPKEMNGTSYFSSYFRFGPHLESCLEQIKKLEPQVVAVSCFAWAYAQTTVELLELLKKHWQKSRNPPLLVVGGPGVTVMPGYFTSSANLVVTGEGENVIEAIEKRAGKISYPSCGEIASSDMLRDFPFVWDIKAGRKNRFTATTMLTRGCPKMCSFCANHLIFGKILRKTALPDVCHGLDKLVSQVLERSQYPETMESRLHLNFEDDNILFQKKYFLSILKYIKDKCDQNRIKFSFSAENGMDYLLLNHETLRAFKSLGLTQLNLSMASMDQKQLEGEKRVGNLKKLESLLEFSEKLDIPVITYFICGLKNDTPVKTVETISYLHGLKTSIGISLYYPVPGLADWQDKELFLKIPPFVCCGASAYPWNDSLSTKELITAFRLARTSNYIKNCAGDRDVVRNIEVNLLKDETLEGAMVELFFDL